MKKLIFLLFLLCLPAQIKSITITPVLSIGGKNTLEKDYLIDDIRDLLVSSNGDIVIKESNKEYFKRYNKDGKYLNNIGRMGGGPGEFNRISAQLISSKDKLIAFDVFHRKMVIYDLDGKSFQEKKVESQTFLEVMKIMEFGDKFYFYQPFYINSTKKIHFLYNQKMQLINSTDNLPVYEYDDYSKHQFSFLYEHNFLKISSDSFVEIPFHYDHIFNLAKIEGDKIRFKKKSAGIQQKKPYNLEYINDPFKEVKKNHLAPCSVFKDRKINKFVKITAKCRVIGSFVHKQKYLVIVYETFNNNKSEYMADLFQTDGTFIRSINLIKPKSEKSLTKIFFADDKYIYYTSSDEEGFAKINKGAYSLE